MKSTRLEGVALFLLMNISVNAPAPAADTELKLPAARCAGSSYRICELLKTSGGESSICREETSYIRSLTPGQAPGNALAVRFNSVTIDGRTYLQYPRTYAAVPEIPSPITAEDGTEVLVAATRDGQYALIPVTVENGNPLHYSKRVKSVFGKDQQLLIDSGDFPVLARTGLHSDGELKTKEMITGFPVSMITWIGRPGRFSGAGFMAEDEDIISVLRADNRTAAELGLTHPQLARPLFHVWNCLLKEIELGKWERFWDRFPHFFYNGRKISLQAHATKGWQISIFQDEIQGSFDIGVSSALTPAETSFLREKYPRLTTDQMDELVEKLTAIHFSEMAPYYIMRYGFYEGHTAYRCDPIAVAFIFGLKSLQDIGNAFQDDLVNRLTDHFTEEPSLE